MESLFTSACEAQKYFGGSPFNLPSGANPFILTGESLLSCIEAQTT
jgi:hypothetical protein